MFVSINLCCDDIILELQLSVCELHQSLVLTL
jgi:hypothetical protein